MRVTELDLESGRTIEREMTEAETEQRRVDLAAAERAAAEPAPDPDAELRAAIASATTIAQLRDALLGKGRTAAVAGRGKGDPPA